ncbi:MAG: hypothetical protein AB8F34_09335 [Akkermansiaceae bacterium]
MSEENYQPNDFIPKPCKEDWHAMTGHEQRRHCAKCDTKVHDLTGMSADEILSMRAKNGGKLCGAFRLGPAVGKPLALGSGIASLALASCSKEKEVVLPGIVCEPPAKHEPAEKKLTQKADKTSAATKPVVPQSNKEKLLKLEKIEPMLLGKICPKNAPDPERDVGPI